MAIERPQRAGKGGMDAGAGKSGPDEIQLLRERYSDLDRKRTAAQTSLENAQNRLNELKSQALKEFGTDDLGELKCMLEHIRAENERKREDYRKHLDEIEAALAEVEQQHAASRQGPEVL